MTKQYLGTASAHERLALLRQMRQSQATLPLDLVDDLLCLELPTRERSLLLDRCDASDTRAYEAFLTRGLGTWDQDLGCAALSLWQQRTEHELWPQLVALAGDEHLPERLANGLLDVAWHAGGAELITRFGVRDDLLELPDETLGLMLHRATQWSLELDPVKEAAERVVLKTVETSFPRNAALVFAAAYMARFCPENLHTLVSHPLNPRAWSETLQSLHQSVHCIAALEKPLESLFARTELSAHDFYREFFRWWPPLWARHLLAPRTIASALAAVVARPTEGQGALPSARAATWDLFAGLSSSTLAAAVQSLGDASNVARARRFLGSLLQDPAPERHMTASAPGRGGSEPTPRRAFFDAVFRGREPSTPAGTSPWKVMLAAATAPGTVKAESLTAAARQLPAIYGLCYLKVAELYCGDEALLPALPAFAELADARSATALARAFLAIGTTTAVGQAVRLLGWPQVAIEAKLEICQLLSAAQAAPVQAELRAVATTLAAVSHRTRGQIEVLDAIKTLLDLPASPEKPSTADTSAQTAAIDAVLRERIPSFADLPMEVQRSLRTARLVFLTLQNTQGIGAIDVSPSIDLQYKALEIFVRTLCQTAVDALVRAPSGILQRKLDLIGYGRSAKGRIDTFETHLATLPMLADLPHFGRMKLNRLLTGVAQFRLGRSFTLDGLKAYAIFFLAFARRRCEFGLERLMSSGFSSDAELFEYVRDLHLFQDVRNQAVHEGLGSHLGRDVEAYWSLTSSLIARTRRFAAR